jgi:D-alanyl-D-alanine dipeptidase
VFKKNIIVFQKKYLLLSSKTMNIKPILLILAFSSAFMFCKQPNNKYGYPLSIVSDTNVYLQQIKADSNKTLVEIKSRIPNIVLDIRYATENNFLKKVFYKEAKAFARLPVVKALQAVQAELNTQGLGVKIYDGYRPYAITVQFYQSFPDSTYVASPWSGSKHNRGCALDMTLVDLKTGNELAMPTPYDSAVKESWADAPVQDSVALKNRELMKAVMAKNGFTVEPSEWWHYNFNGWRDYPLMDMSFELCSLRIYPNS